jgi:hypothetical protein
MTVKTNTTKKAVDKADTFGVSLKSNDGTLFLGMKEATATLAIKSEDDVLHFNFPTEQEFVLEIYPRSFSEPLPRIQTQQTPLPEESASEEPLEEEA